jgi:hypothetical protein
MVKGIANNMGTSCHANSVFQLLRLIHQRFPRWFEDKGVNKGVIQILRDMENTDVDELEIRIQSLKFPSLGTDQQQDVQELLLPILDRLSEIDKRYTPFQLTHEYGRLSTASNEMELVVKEQTTHLMLNSRDFFAGSLESILNKECRWHPLEGTLQVCRTNISMTPALIIVMVPYASHLNDTKICYTRPIPESIEIEFEGCKYPFNFLGSIFHRGLSVSSGHYFNILKQGEDYFFISDDSVYRFKDRFDMGRWQKLQAERWAGLTPVVLLYIGAGF